MKWKKFTKAERSTFTYWWWHNLAFNYTAIKLEMWKPRYLLHDIEKPFLMLLWKDYKRVQKWHRENNNHHLEYKKKKYDWNAMFIDWECSALTKLDAQKNAMDTMYQEIKRTDLDDSIKHHLFVEFKSINHLNKIKTLNN